MRRSSRLLAILVALSALTTVAHAAPLGPVKGNPADRMLATPIDPMRYDEATHCVRHVPKGSKLFQAWLEHHVRGLSWGSCAASCGASTRPRCTPRGAPSTGTSTTPTRATARRPGS